MNLPALKFKNKVAKHPIIQGGMGIGLSGYKLAGTVAKEGGIGVLSSVALNRQVSARIGKKLNCRDATAEEVREARKICGPTGVLGMNIMVAVINDYAKSVYGSMDGGVDVIISGAGLPMNLPEIAKQHERINEVALIPIVSSGRALKLVLKRWARYDYVPDAIIVEGPLAGGHVGWKTREETLQPQFKLELLVQEVLNTLAEQNLNLPVIAAGGIYTHQDIADYIKFGCAGVQMGTRFLATHESAASEDYKKIIIECKQDDIKLAQHPGSPCGLPFRAISQSPFFQQAIAQTRTPKCDKGYLLRNGQCPAKTENIETFCICNGLLAAINLNNLEEKELYTIGATGYRINEIVSVHELISELTSNIKHIQPTK